MIARDGDRPRRRTKKYGFNIADGRYRLAADERNETNNARLISLASPPFAFFRPVFPLVSS